MLVRLTAFSVLVLLVARADEAAEAGSAASDAADGAAAAGDDGTPAAPPEEASCGKGEWASRDARGLLKCIAVTKCGGTDDTAPTVSASPTPAHLNIHPENLHLPAGIQFVSSQPVPLKPNSTSAPLDLVDALDGQRYVLRIRPAGDGAPSGEPVRIPGKTYWTRAAGTRSPSVEFDHAGQIVTISAPEDAMGSRPPSRAQSQRLLERMLQM